MFTSAGIIEMILGCLGLKREDISTYRDYSLPDGGYLRLRLSDHGVNLSTWYKKNLTARLNDQTVPKLNESTNIAITFSPGKNECEERGIELPQKIINKTKVKTPKGNNVKPQFSVGHISYASWRLTGNEVGLIISALFRFIEEGIYYDPIGLKSGKVLAWEDISNMLPKKLTRSIDTMKLRENRD